MPRARLVASNVIFQSSVHRMDILGHVKWVDIIPDHVPRLILLLLVLAEKY